MSVFSHFTTAFSLLTFAASTFHLHASEAETWNLQTSAEAVAKRVMTTQQVKGDYMLDLALEAMLELSVLNNKPEYKDYVLQILTQRGWTPTADVSWRRQWFCCVTFGVYQSTGDKAWLPVFIRESALQRKENERSVEGGILHPRGEKRGGGQALLIDGVQEFASRMAKTGSVTGDVSYYRECAEQFRLYHQLIRDPQSKLWTQGRGWLKDHPEQLSPGAWSRGHGWLMRGMETSLRYLPRDSAEFREVQGYLRELADTLIALQSEDGLWHCLLNRPAADSPLETSGSGLIACHLARAWKAGFLPEEKYRAAALKTFDALPKYVRKDGVVLNVSPGPGPLETEEPWLKTSYPEGDPHGTFAILFAAVAEKILAETPAR